MVISQAQKICPFLKSPDGCGHLASPEALPRTCRLPPSSGGGFGPSVPVCILAVRIICSFQERSMEGHTLFLFPLVRLWDRLPFHFCFIGFLKGCQLDIGKWGFSLLQSAESKHQYVAI